MDKREMRKERRHGRTPWGLSRPAVAVYLALALLLIGGVTFSRYMTGDTAADAARVAGFVCDTQSQELQTIIIGIDNMTPGSEKKYSFDVTNTRGSATCEVDQEYTISVADQGNLPLEYTLTKAGGSAVDIDSNTATLKAATNQTDTYTLTVQWSKTEENSKKYNDEYYADEIDLVTVTVRSAQID